MSAKERDDSAHPVAATTAHEHDGRRQHYINMLSTTGLFQEFSHADLSQLHEFSEEVIFKKGGCIFSYKDISDCMYVIITGEVIIERKRENSYEQIAQYTNREFFGESGLFLNMPRGARARAIESTILLRFPSSHVSLTDIVRKNPALSSLLLNTLIQHSASRIRSVNRLISENNRWVNALKEQIIVDKTTSLYTNKSYKEEFIPKLNRNAPITVWMIKPRNFKRINDTYGHETGDAVLYKMGVVVGGEIKGKGYAFRYMSNEFAIVSDTLSKEEGTRLVKKIMNILSTTDLHSLGVDKNVRLSLMSHSTQYPKEHSELTSLLDHAHEEFMRIFSRE